MRTEVKYFEWPDLERGGALASELQSTLLVFAPGPLGGPGAETFQVTVCTPQALTEMIRRDGVVVGRHFLFVDSVDTSKVENTIRDRLRRMDGTTWSDLVATIGRIGLWEFEDYKPGG